MEVMMSTKDKINAFIKINITDTILRRGEVYFRNGLVSEPLIMPDSRKIIVAVLGTRMYRVEFLINPNSSEFIESFGCNCPYTGEGACKHIAASALWIQANQNFVDQELTLPLSASSANGIIKTTNRKPKKVNKTGWVIKNFTQFNRNQLRNFLSPNRWQPDDLVETAVSILKKGVFKVELTFLPDYSESIFDTYSLTIKRKKDDLTVSCSCGKKGYSFCNHAFDYFQELTEKDQMDIFIEPDAESLNELGKTMLRDYGFDENLDWNDYFEYGIIDGNRAIIANEGLENLISPNKWNLSTEEIFTGNPENELNGLLPGKEEHTFELGFCFDFKSKEDFSLVPFVARESKKGVPMSVGYKLYRDLPYRARVIKHKLDSSLLAVSSAIKSEGRDIDFDEKLNRINDFIDAIVSHPNLFYATQSIRYSLRKSDVERINFHRQPPRLKYVLTEKDQFISISVMLQYRGADLSIHEDTVGFVHSRFLKINDDLFFIPNTQDANHYTTARLVDGKMISTALLPELFDKYLHHALRKSDLELKGFKTYKLDTQKPKAVAKEIYLSEVDNFMILRPFIRYENDYLMDALTQENHWEVSENSLVKTEQETNTAQEFRTSLGEIYPDFEELFNRSDYLHISYNSLLKDNLFIELFDGFKKNGFKVFGLRDLKGLKINPYPGKVVYSVSSGIDWFEVDAKMVFGDQEISIEQLRKRFKPGSNYIELGDGSRGMVPQEWLAKLEKLFKHGEIKDDKLVVSTKKFTLVDELFDELEEEVSSEIRDKKEKLLNFDKMQRYPLPKGIKGTLRHYQEDGFQWLCFLDDFKWGGILADDMGLGKTLQIITFIKHILIKNKQTNLIVVPTSLLFNWENEIAKFAPTLKVHFHYGAQRLKSTKGFKKYDIVFTSYGHMLSDIELLKEHEFNYVILDESQAIKNPASKRFKAARLLKANNRIAMTGTPIENNTFDLYAQMSFLNPGFLGSAKGFKADFAKAIDTERNEVKAGELQRLIKPFVLRRTKTQVATELPDKTEEILYCEMDKSQQKVYDAFRNQYRQRLIEKIDEEGVNKARFAVLEGLTKLRQICDTPEILPGEEKYTGKSVKTDTLMMHIKEKTTNHKILVFSQFVKMLRVIENELQAEGIPYAYLDGQSTTKQRQASVEHFQNDESCRVFLISLKAGGTGLNLMAADYVFLVDPWWNPAVENQAIDRCYRIGQDKKVIAYRMICKNTVEEKIMDLQKKKKSIAGDIVTTDEGVLKKLKKEDLIGLFG